MIYAIAFIVLIGLFLIQDGLWLPAIYFVGLLAAFFIKQYNDDKNLKDKQRREKMSDLEKELENSDY